MELSPGARRALLCLDDDWEEVTTVFLNASAEFWLEDDPLMVFTDVATRRRFLLQCDIHRAALRFEMDIHFFN